MAKQPFQLRPKHLVTATLAVCILAIVGLIIGVVGTFNPRDEARKQDEKSQHKAQQANRVEVWKPSGASSQGAIVLNPDALNQTNRPQPDRAEAREEQAARNPFLPSSSERNRMDEDKRADEPRRVRPRPDRERELSRPRPAESKPVPPAQSLQNPITAPVESVPVRPRSEPKPDIVHSEPKAAEPPKPRNEPKPEPRPAPAQPKPQKEVMDNLF